MSNQYDVSTLIINRLCERLSGGFMNIPKDLAREVMWTLKILHARVGGDEENYFRLGLEIKELREKLDEQDTENRSLKHDIERHLNIISEQEKELERRKYDGVHTCSDTCPRLACVQRREIERLREALRVVFHSVDNHAVAEMVRKVLEESK